MRLLTSKPVYGSDCIKSMKIELVLDCLANPNSPRISKVIEDLAMPQSVFNPFISF